MPESEPSPPEKTGSRLLHIDGPPPFLRFVEKFCSSKGMAADSTDSEATGLHYALVKRYRDVTAVDALNLETPAAEIDVSASLFGEGLGLDSIDALELVTIGQRRRLAGRTSTGRTATSLP